VTQAYNLNLEHAERLTSRKYDAPLQAHEAARIAALKEITGGGARGRDPARAAVPADPAGETATA
jgi:hypothetical protein